MIGPKRLDEIAEEGAKAFWNRVAEMYPGDPDQLDAGTIIVLEAQMKAAIQRYVERCVAATEDGSAPRLRCSNIQSNPQEELTREQFAEMAGVTVKKVSEWVADQLIDWHRRLDGKIVFFRKDVEHFLRTI